MFDNVQPLQLYFLLSFKLICFGNLYVHEKVHNITEKVDISLHKDKVIF